MSSMSSMSSMSNMSNMSRAQTGVIPAAEGSKTAATAATVGAVGTDAQHHLMPVPATLRLTGARLRLDQGFRYSISITSGQKSDLIERCAQGFVTRLRSRFALEATVAPAPEGEVGLQMRVCCDTGGSDLPSLDADESYELVVDAERGIDLRAAQPMGILRGFATLAQLVEEGAGCVITCAEIEDRPRFPWRGLLLDVSRHFVPVPVLLRNLDAMSALKFNVLHWHLTDDHGFRVESKRFPELHRRGGDHVLIVLYKCREKW